jgi:SNF2 family DNA or RNA helicase
MVEELLSEGDRALIFSQFAGMGERLQRHLSTTFGEDVLFLHGGVPAHKRDHMVERFQTAGKGSPRLFVLSLKAGGTGLNLHGREPRLHNSAPICLALEVVLGETDLGKAPAALAGF